MNAIEKAGGFVIVLILFWAGFGSFLWGLAAAIAVIGILAAEEMILKKATVR